MLRRYRGRNGGARKTAGQSLLETAIMIPVLLTLVFNAINFAYFWYVALSLTAAPRLAVEYATQGGAGKYDSPICTASDCSAIVNIAQNNLTYALTGATGNPIRVCVSTIGVNNAGTTTQQPQCAHFGGAFTFLPAAPDNSLVDPEAPNYILARVDVEYTVTPLIPGGVFNVVLPSSLQFHRQVTMRSLY